MKKTKRLVQTDFRWNGAHLLMRQFNQRQWLGPIESVYHLVSNCVFYPRFLNEFCNPNVSNLFIVLSHQCMESSGLQVVAAGANVIGCGWSAGRKLAVASAVDLQPVWMLCIARPTAIAVCMLMKQEMMGWHWHQVDHMQVISTSLHTDNHASTSSHNFLQARCSS